MSAASSSLIPVFSCCFRPPTTPGLPASPGGDTAVRGGHQRGRDVPHHPGHQVRGGLREGEEEALRPCHRRVLLPSHLGVPGLSRPAGGPGGPHGARPLLQVGLPGPPVTLQSLCGSHRGGGKGLSLVCSGAESPWGRSSGCCAGSRAPALILYSDF